MKPQPLNDRILIKPDEPEKKKGSILLPDQAQEPPGTAKVVATGPGSLTDKGERTPTGVKPGDRVLYSKYSGSEIELDGEELVFLKADQVLAVIE